MATRFRFERVLAVMGAAALAVMATDAATYAATGSSLILGRINSANTSTTITNTGNGPALKLITKSTAAAPFTVNGKGKVVNLYADRANTANTATNATNAANATKLGGSTLAQVKATAAPRVSNVVWVAKSGGQFTSVKAALSSIIDNDATHRYLVSVAPGTYVEPGGIELKPYVDIIGAGEGLTTITCECTGASLGDNAGSVVYVAGEVPTTLSDLTVENTGSLINAGISLSSAGSLVVLERLTVRAGATAGSTTTAGVVSFGTAPTIDDVHIAVAGDGPIGIDSTSSLPTLRHVDIDVAVQGSDGYGIRTISGAATISDVTITIGGSGNVTGIRNFSAGSTITDFSIEAGSGTHVTGVDLRSSAATISRGSIYVASPDTGASLDGIFMNIGSPIVDGVRVDVLARAGDAALRADAASPLIRNSTFTSTTSAVTAVSGSTVTMTNSTAVGTVDGSGYHCGFVADGVTGAAVTCPA